MTRRMDKAGAHRLQHGAAFLLGVAAPHEAALVQIRPELHKGLRQAVLQLQIQLIGLKGGEARGVHNVRPAAQVEQLHVPGGVASPAQRLAHIPHLELKRRIQGIQDAGLSHTGIPCKGRQLPGDQGLQFLDPLPGLRADPQSWKSGGCVNGVQCIGTVQITFVQQHHHAASFQCCDGRHPVNEERVCFGDGTGGDDHQLVDVGHRRPGKCVLPGQDGLHKALAVPQLPDLHPVPHQRGDALLPKLAPGPAGEHLAAGVHIVEAAEGLSDPSLTHRRSPHGYCSHPSRRPHTPPRRPFRCLSAYRGGCPVCSPPIH